MIDKVTRIASAWVILNLNVAAGGNIEGLNPHFLRWPNTLLNLRNARHIKSQAAGKNTPKFTQKPHISPFEAQNSHISPPVAQYLPGGFYSEIPRYFTLYYNV